MELLCWKCAQDTKMRALTPCTLHVSQSVLPQTPTISSDLGETYLYDQCLTDRKIRLLKIHPRRTDEIECSLDTISLNGDDVFHALSYAWGGPDTVQRIICNGKYIEITQNLYSALCQFREDGKLDYIWVDAICINQANLDEKTHQVRMMRRIYERAELVIAWLGVEEATDTAGFALMHQIYHRLGPVQLYQNYATIDFSQQSELGLPVYDDPQWAAFCSILYRPYFFRVWIIQEIIVARRCIFQCGGTSVPSELVLGTGGIIPHYHYLTSAVTANSPMSGDWATNTNLKSIWYMKIMHDAGTAFTIFDLLWQTRLFKASEPRDKIFGLVSLASDVEADFIDYGRDIRDLQIEITKRGLAGGFFIGATLFGYMDSELHSDDLPSWVIDWMSGGPAPTPLVAAYPYVLASLSGHSSVASRLPALSFGSSNTLRISGLIFDSIQSVVHSKPYETPTPTLMDLDNMCKHSEEMEAWEEDCWALARTACPNYEYVTGEDLMEVYWRTLIFNTSHWQTRAGPEYEKYWHVWLSAFCELNKVCATFKASKRGDPDSQPVRVLDRYPTLAMLNTILAVAYYSFRPRKAWHWLLASSIFAVANWRLSNGMSYPSKKYVEMIWMVQQIQSHQRFGDAFTESFKRFSYGRKFCTTAGGYIGWVPSTAQSGDFVCFLESGSIPFIIRKCEGGYRLLGDSYLHGLMDERRFLEFSGSNLIELV